MAHFVFTLALVCVLALSSTASFFVTRAHAALNAYHPDMEESLKEIGQVTLCEACKVYHDHLFDIFAREGRVEMLHLDHSVCDEHFWHYSIHSHSQDFTQACENIEYMFDHEYDQDTAEYYRHWPKHKVIHFGTHESDQFLVQIKRDACVGGIQVCTNEDIPKKLDRSRRECEKCHIVVKALAGYLSRYDRKAVSEYRRDGLLEFRMGQCRHLWFEREQFDDPTTNSTIDISDYCADFVNAKYNDVISAFAKHEDNVPAIVFDLCPPPCKLRDPNEGKDHYEL